MMRDMTIQAVVFDIGGVLEITPSLAVTERWEARLGLEAGEINNRMADVWYGGGIGTISEADVHRALAERFGFDNRQADEFMSWIWREYLGCANTELIEYARRLRPQYRTGILSNSFVGAREREQAAYGFEDLVDEIIYSHECGLSKPDPAIYALTCERLRVAPQEMIFLDDYEPNVEGARQVGIHAVLYKDNAQAVRDIEVLLALSPPETHRPPAARRAEACSRSHVPPVRTRHGGFDIAPVALAPRKRCCEPGSAGKTAIGEKGSADAVAGPLVPGVKKRAVPGKSRPVCLQAGCGPAGRIPP
jgi:epoxide hydrolase-like predicted phosphatase